MVSIQDPNADCFQGLAVKKQSISGVDNFSVCCETSIHFCMYDKFKQINVQVSLLDLPTLTEILVQDSGKTGY